MPQEKFTGFLRQIVYKFLTQFLTSAFVLSGKLHISYFIDARGVQFLAHTRPDINCTAKREKMDWSVRTRALLWSLSSRRVKGNAPVHRRSWTLIRLFSVCIVAICTACGNGSSSSSGTVTITIAPQSVSLKVTSSAQFTATVTNSSNMSVTWQVNGVTGGNTTSGTISTSGLYTAPNSIPATTITVTAISQADTTKTATATVTLTNANSLAVSPGRATVPAGGQQTFTATLGNNPVAANWSLSCQSATAGGCGTISSSGIYTAPLSPPLGQSVVVVASSQDNSANPANAVVEVTFGSGTLIGQYSFALTGFVSGQPFSEVGSVQFDGTGGIVGGMEDRAGQAVPITITGGSYSADSTGRVTATIHTSSGDETWQFTLITHSHALVMRADSAIARGDLDLQNTSQFGLTFNGNFSFQLAGSASAAIPVSAMVGALVFDQHGNITSGVADSNIAGVVSTNMSATGTSTAASLTDGRGTLSLTTTLGTQTFAYYVLDSNTANLVETDAGHSLAGNLVLRTSSTVNTGNFTGSYGFIFEGANSIGTVGEGGTFVVDPNGNITSGIFDIGTDTVFTPGSLSSGNFVVTDPITGRTVVTMNAGASVLQYVVYPPDPNGQLAFLEIDSNNVTSGHALLQGGTVTGTSSFSGQFGFLAGEATSSVQRTITGIAALGPRPTGVLDLNNGGAVTLDTALQSSSFSMTSSSARGSLQLQAGTYQGAYAAYAVDAGTVLLMETDGKGVLTGIIQKQF